MWRTGTSQGAVGQSRRRTGTDVHISLDASMLKLKEIVNK